MSCVEVCPPDCIYAVGQDAEDPSQPLMVVIDQEECIGCGACVIECPVEAISKNEQVPEGQEAFITLGEMHVGRGDQSGPDEELRLEKQDIADRALELHAQLTAT